MGSEHSETFGINEYSDDLGAFSYWFGESGHSHQVALGGMTDLRLLSIDQRNAFERDGFLVLEGFARHDDLDALRARATELVDAFDPADVVSIFSTKQQTRTSDDYFLDSGDKIRFFFEEEAFDPEGNLRQAKELSINKIGHALHDLDTIFRPFSHSTRLADVAADIGMMDPLVLQSMYIFKQPRIGGV